MQVLMQKGQEDVEDLSLTLEKEQTDIPKVVDSARQFLLNKWKIFH